MRSLDQNTHFLPFPHLRISKMQKAFLGLSVCLCPTPPSLLPSFPFSLPPHPSLSLSIINVRAGRSIQSVCATLAQSLKINIQHPKCPERERERESVREREVREGTKRQNSQLYPSCRRSEELCSSGDWRSFTVLILLYQSQKVVSEQQFSRFLHFCMWCKNSLCVLDI